MYGTDHPEKHTESWVFFTECVTFHLQTKLQYDTAEAQRFYIRNGLKKPNSLSIPDFFQMIQCLNSYLDLLPCL